MGQSVLIFFNSRLGLSKYMNSVDNSVLFLDKSPYKHQNETMGPYFPLIFGGGGGLRANAPFPCPLFFLTNHTQQMPYTSYGQTMNC